ncbi:MAG: esterase family protein [Alicyclobacillus herbarius]|uniref:alpha/beta hydrolase n=1 Tax=Alicyclobacillus herbarius TaxID=122960 RepID=UPI00235642A8|nr:alpha/beta hydrolase-fold protein [Alicyclobacillus herbarius]MCL6631381.1 esterase family protein [Alicyclobacillus herbarius]
MSQSASSQRVIESHEIYSSHLCEDRTIKVCLPPGYSREEAYPVLFCHDGNEFITHGRIATIACERMTSGELSPLVIVCMAMNKRLRSADYDISGDRHEAYSRFVLEECIPYIEEEYAIAPDKGKWFMAGISLGAAASLSIHLQRPDVFSQLLLFSGAFYPPLQAKVAETHDLSKLAGYMLVGRQETAVETKEHGTLNFYEFNRQMHTLLTERGAVMNYHEADGTHIWGFWQKHLPEALAWLEQRLHGATPV